GTDQQVHEAFFRFDGDNFWHHNVPSAADIQIVPGTSPTSWYTPNDNTQHLAYVGTDQQVHEAFFRLSGDDNQWHHNVPSIADIGVAPGTSPTSWFTPKDVVQHLAYVGTDQQVHEAFFRFDGDNFWHHNVPSAADIQIAPGTSPTSWYTPGDNVQHLAYIGTDQHVHEAFFRLTGDDNQWHHNVPSAADIQIAPGTSPTSWYTPNDNTQHLAYVGTDQQVHEAFYRLPDFRPELARQAIENHWLAAGGPLSTVGLPVGPSISPYAIDGGFQADFRSGGIRILDVDPEIVPGDWVRIWWVGLECAIRQEGEDEIYGTVFCHAPGRAAKANVVIFPGGNETLEMGEPGARIAKTNELLYEGPLVNVTLGVTLIENDSGDVEEISQEISNKITEASASLLAGLTGVPAEAIDNQTWYRDGIGAIVGLVLDDLFGIGDDEYLPASKLVQWQKLAKFAEPGSYQRPGEPQVIDAFNDIIDASGVDDAGDRGHYRFFFLYEHANHPG
ncbi:hypothetical protein, partial [Nocardia sp. NPDC060259]|uniref:hypothetical protein n=1 Tax=Nocardia sp. NPDC060259 TaxID=3347088 RepID=UPI003651F5AA